MPPPRKIAIVIVCFVSWDGWMDIMFLFFFLREEIERESKTFYHPGEKSPRENGLCYLIHLCLQVQHVHVCVCVFSSH